MFGILLFMAQSIFSLLVLFYKVEHRELNYVSFKLNARFVIVGGDFVV